MANSIASLERVLVITKFGFLGDTIVATPFLRRLREAAPEAQITLLAGPGIPELLAGCPYVDQFKTLDRKVGRALATTLSDAAAIRGSRYDAAFILNRSIHSAILAALAGIPLRVGHDTELRGFSLTVRVPYDWNKPDRECALDLLRAVGAPAESAIPELWVTTEEAVLARRRLLELGAHTDSMLVGMQPGANDAYVREWGAQRFAIVADRLAAEYGAKIALFGGAAERGTSENAAGCMREKPIVLTGSTGLREVLALISLCRLWIGNDAGLLHAAAALGVPTVGIFGPTKARRWGYAGGCNRTVVVYPTAPARDPKTIRRCLDAITPEMVYDAAQEIIEPEYGRRITENESVLS